MSKKVLHELSIEELINLANEAKTDEPKVQEATEAAKFIYALTIRHGDVRIPAQLIYYAYREWKGWSNKPQPKPFFFRDFTKYFESVRTKEGISYLLDPKPFDLSQETYFMVRKQIRDERSKRQNKKTKK